MPELTAAQRGAATPPKPPRGQWRCTLAPCWATGWQASPEPAAASYDHYLREHFQPPTGTTPIRGRSRGAR